jgi:peptidyl-prolyl cis-trans isomerase D
MVLMSVLVVSFAIWGIADIFRGYGRQTLIRVGDVEITPQEYMQTQRDVLRSMGEQAGLALSLQEGREQGLNSRVLQQLVMTTVLDNHARELGLDVSDGAILKQIMNDPNLKDAAGNFNAVAFRQALQNLGLSEQGFISEQRKRELRGQISNTIGRAVITPDVLLNALARYNGETRTLRYVVVPKTAAGPLPEPTDDDLHKFYNNHKAKYTQPETRKIALLSATPDAMKDQIKITDAEIKAEYEATKDKLGEPEQRHVQQISFPDKATADAAYQRIQSGTDFVAFAKERGLGESDIDLGTLKREQFADPAVADAAFKLEANKVSEPTMGKLGSTVLIRVTEIVPGKTPSYDEAKANVEKSMLKDRAQGILLELHDKVEDERASGAKLREIAEKIKLPYQVVDQVDRQGKAPDGKEVNLPDKPNLLTAAFTSDVGVENDPLDAKDGGYIWYEVEGVNPQQLKPFDQVKDEVTKDWQLDTQRMRLAKFADGLVQSLKDGKTLDDIAKELNGQVLVSDPMKRGGMTVNILPAAVEQAFTLPQGASGSAPGIDDGRVVFQVDKVTPPPAVGAPAAENLKKRLTPFLNNDLIFEYVTGLENRYGVKVNQAELAKLSGSEDQP